MKKTILFLLPLAALVISCAGSPQGAPEGLNGPAAALLEEPPAREAWEDAPRFEPAEFAAAEPEEPAIAEFVVPEPADAAADIAALELSPPEPAVPDVVAVESPPLAEIPEISLSEPPFLAFEAEPEPEPIALEPEPIAAAPMPVAPAAQPIAPVQPPPQPIEPAPPLPLAAEELPPPPLAPPPLVPAAAMDFPVFAPAMPELPRPVADFRNLLPPAPVFSRVVHAAPGQTVEVPFRGNGWTFLGETGARRGIVFESRRNDSEGQTFVFRLEAGGEYALRFYRHDFVRDIILNDHVRVIAADGAPAAGRVVAERWPSAADEARVLRAASWPVPAYAAGMDPFPAEQPPMQAAAPQEAAVQPMPAAAPIPAAPAAAQPAPPAPAPVPAAQPAPIQAPPAAAPAIQPAPAQAAPPAAVPAAQPAPVQAPPAILPPYVWDFPADPFDLLRVAREEFGEGRVAEAISRVDAFRAYYPSGSDEAWWLLGQFYEADSPSRNVLLALSYYRRLVSEFPQSGRLADARGRIAFIERFFLNIR